MVHRSLVAAANSIGIQSVAHRDGWGVAYYINNIPHIIKSASHAGGDKVFTRVSGIVASETVLAHIRQATEGENNVLNSHPFQYGNWVFGHNGQIYNFAKHRMKLVRNIAPFLQRFLLGDTDSEVLFYLFLTELTRIIDLHRLGTPIEDVSSALVRAKRLVQEICDGTKPEEKSLLTTIVTDGHTMVGTRVGKPLSFSTYKRLCLDRHKCRFLSPECEAPSLSGHVNHLIITSEELSGENVWEELKEEQIVGVDWRMHLHRGTMDTGLKVISSAASTSTTSSAPSIPISATVLKDPTFHSPRWAPPASPSPSSSSSSSIRFHPSPISHPLPSALNKV